MKQFTRQEIDKLLSLYIAKRKELETWHFLSIQIDDDNLLAVVGFDRYFASPTDASQFHLSTFSASEILGQLTVLHAHHAAGLTDKRHELWLLETRNRYLRPIRDPTNIVFTMAIADRKESRRGPIFEFRTKVEDNSGGLFEFANTSLLAIR